MSRLDFWSLVNKNGPNGCWVWQGPVSADGYGRYMDKRIHHITKLGHNQLHIHSGYTANHMCLNKLCVNPDHLEVITRLPKHSRVRYEHQEMIAWLQFLRHP